MKKSDYIVFDTETTGLFNDSQVIEIGAIKYHDHRVVDVFHEYINPYTQIPIRITQINGIDNDMVDGCLGADVIIPKFVEWVEDYSLIGHNVSFDMKMINQELLRLNMKKLQNTTIDTVTIARMIFNLHNYKLETIKNYLGLSLTSHRAIDDVEVTAAIYQLYCQK